MFGHYVTFRNSLCKPGASVMQATTITSSSISVYMSRVEVELAHDGHAEQHSEHAALPQQHANYTDMGVKKPLWYVLLIRKFNLNLYK